MTWLTILGIRQVTWQIFAFVHFKSKWWGKKWFPTFSITAMGQTHKNGHLGGRSGVYASIMTCLILSRSACMTNAWTKNRLLEFGVFQWQCSECERYPDSFSLSHHQTPPHPPPPTDPSQALISIWGMQEWMSGLSILHSLFIYSWGVNWLDRLVMDALSVLFCTRV